MGSQNEGIAAALKNDLVFLEIVSDLSKLAAVLWLHGREEDTFQWISGGAAEHPCVCDEAFRKTLEANCRADRPGIYFENDYVFYGLMQVGGFCIALGPSVRNAASKEYIQKYSAEHGMTSSVSMEKIGLTALRQYMDLMFCHFSGSAIPYEDISFHGAGSDIGQWASLGALEEYQLAQSENDRSHRSGIDFEKELLQLVRNGDTDSLKKLLGGIVPDVGEVGEIVNEKNKEMEYMVVSILTLMTRAAIEGGVRSEVAYEFGDIYLKKLAAARANGESFTMLGNRAMMEFAELVKRAKEEKRSQSYVEACKDYVEKHLRKDIAVADIAPAIGVSRTYLSHLFRQTEGITVQQYIQREKCRHAARMLQYSDYSVALIAEYFGFSSQSYFGACFRNWYGVTPREYRRSNFK